MAEIKLYKSPYRAVKMMLLCSIFVGMGLWGITTDTMPSWIAWLNIGFFGMAYPVGLFHLLDRRPQIIINETGIYDNTIRKEFINWEIIRDAYLIDLHRQKFICLIVDDQHKPSGMKSELYQKVAKLNELVGAQELNISLGQIKIDPEKLTRLILLMRAANKTDQARKINNALAEWNG